MNRTNGYEEYYYGDPDNEYQIMKTKMLTLFFRQFFDIYDLSDRVSSITAKSRPHWKAGNGFLC